MGDSIDDWDLSAVVCFNMDAFTRLDSLATSVATANDGKGQPLLQVSGLKVEFKLKGGQTLIAVDGVDLDIRRGEVVGLVGESGCGKTVFTLCLPRLIERPGQIVNGSIVWEGKDVLRLSDEEIRHFRGREISMIFQNPQSSLNPAHSVGRQLCWVIGLHRRIPRSAAREEALELLRHVHMPDPQRAMEAYPHEFSGGMCQRIMIAMALACRPKLLVADEPTASLDVTVQAQIMDLLLEIREKFSMSILLVSHDLGVIARMCDRIAVMYLGRIVELAQAADLYQSPKHPYTQALLSAIPAPDPSQRKRFMELLGDAPSAIDIPPGCRFRNRCSYAEGRCAQTDPVLLSLDGRGHSAACVLYQSSTQVNTKSDEKEREQPIAGR
jgi:oligopeptide/dipeptide ABC transporter ATP-binding protein